jgi:hypothetical protein
VEWRCPHKEEFNDLHSSLNIIWLIKSGRMRQSIWHIWEIWVVHTGFWWKEPRETDCFEDRGTDGMIPLKCIFKNWDGKGGHGMDWSGSRKGKLL